MADITPRTPWVPSVTAATPGDLSVSYPNASFRQGFFGGVSPLIVVSFYVRFVPTYTTASGLLAITGLPLIGTVQGDNTLGGSVTFVSGVGFTWPTGSTQLTASFLTATNNPNLSPNGGPYIYLTGLGSALASPNVPITAIASGSQIDLRGFLIGMTLP